ncbi:MAG: TusE/DsrC/DsvC family sulfur relay protein [Candidatus Eisenbacteria bacterium]
MPSAEIAGVTVDVNEEGYLTDSGQWTKAIGEAIAAEQGLSPLTDAHWKVIDFLRKDTAEQGQVPSIRRIKNAGGIPTKELYALFPDGPVKKSTKIAGLPKPASCI